MSGALIIGILNIACSLFLGVFSYRTFKKVTADFFRRILRFTISLSFSVTIMNLISLSKVLRFHNVGIDFVVWELADFCFVFLTYQLISYYQLMSYKKSGL